MAKEEFHDRLGEVARGHKSVNGFSRLCGVSNSLMLSYLSGKSLPGLGNLLKIAKAAQVSVLWLATGEGSKYPSPQWSDAGLGMEEARARLAAIDSAVEKAGEGAGRRLAPSALAEIRIYSFLNGLDEKEILDLARKWGSSRLAANRANLELLRGLVQMVEEMLVKAGVGLSPEKKGEVIALLYEWALSADDAGGPAGRELAERLIALAR